MLTWHSPYEKHTFNVPMQQKTLNTLAFVFHYNTALRCHWTGRNKIECYVLESKSAVRHFWLSYVAHLHGFHHTRRLTTSLLVILADTNPKRQDVKTGVFLKQLDCGFLVDHHSQYDYRPYVQDRRQHTRSPENTSNTRNPPIENKTTFESCVKGKTNKQGLKAVPYSHCCALNYVIVNQCKEWAIRPSVSQPL